MKCKCANKISILPILFLLMSNSRLMRITRAGCGSQTTIAIEHIIGRKPIDLPFVEQFSLNNLFH